MKKIKILLFTFIFMFLSIPSVFAEWNVIPLTKVEISKGNSWSVYTTTSRIFDNIAFAGALVEDGGEVTKGTFYLRNPSFLDYSKKYSITFFIYWGSVSYRAGTDSLYESIPPLVTLDSNSCYVKPIGMNGGQYGSNPSNIFNVVCDNYAPRDNPVIEIYSNANPAIGTLYFGVQNGWGFSIGNSELNEIINKTENIENSLGDLNTGVNDLNDNITDSNIDSSDDVISDLKDKIPSNAVISDLLLLPVRFLQNFVNALGSSCSRFSLGSLYGTELFMPCINLESYLGSAIWTTIDLIISGFFIYSLRKKFIQIYENLTNLKNGGNEVD